ncbi:MAG: metallophosphoesterase family protein [Bacteroidales bacterium]
MKGYSLLTGALVAMLTLSCTNESLPLPDYESLFPAKDSSALLCFDENKRFRILQLTDIHYDQTIYNMEIERNIATLVSLADPDLIILTGDIVSGQPVPFRWLTFINYLARLNKPYVITLGNHDSESKLKRPDLYTMIRYFPNCENDQFEDPTAFTPGDMVVEVSGYDENKIGALLYLFDSNEYTTANTPLGIQPAQTTWFTQRSQDYKEKGVNNRIPGLIFMHVPLPEYRKATDNPEIGMVGNRGEKEYYGRDDNGLFQAMQEDGNICGIFCGHDHFNDYILDYNNIALCYGRKSGSHNTYQRYPSGGRVIDLYQGEKGFSTFIIECDGTQKYHYVYTATK